ncbi:hypothetical protein [Flavobacterium praedii]|uniref:hypothetical protein n=1 Tax=Flavobacterium praedii TaxID=3002900 RepID=UPI002481FCDB|nr:hypothetical protein [Flavobacterium praedii]
MTNLEATFTDISDWQKNIYYSTGGTRSKKIVIHPFTNDEYFFKGSKINKINEETLYPTEFWSEIVSSKIGQFLGFPMLDYNVAYDKNDRQKIGCISKSMVLNSENNLTEGITYLTGYDSKYNPEKDQNKYTFQFIQNALIDFNFTDYIKNIIEIIILDSIIGNSDRHQENWGIIMYYRSSIDKINEELLNPKVKFWSKIDMKFKRFVNEFFILLHKEERQISKTNLKLHSNTTLHKFAPIYDSGCCLGREHTDEKVLKMINDQQMIQAYIRKGESEIHWEGYLKKRKHFELIQLLIENYPTETKKLIVRVEKKYKSDSIKEIIDNIDINVPTDLINFKLSETRKKLMFKLVTLRIEKLIQYL